jgi:hypothetical protein
LPLDVYGQLTYNLGMGFLSSEFGGSPKGQTNVTKLTERLELRATPETRRRIDVLCEYYDLTRSELLRRTVDTQYDYIRGNDPQGVENVENAS